MSGRCRFCRCTHFSPCPEGCAWANRDQTVCTSCVGIARAWARRRGARPALMVRPFARGYVAAEWQTERRPASNPYAPGSAAWRYWRDGFSAAERSMLPSAAEAWR